MKISQYLDSTYLKTPVQANISQDETKENIVFLVEEAIVHDFKLVMIRADYVTLAKELISKSNSKVLVGTVIGFHEGTYSLDEKLREAQEAINLNADELDFVINYNAFKAGEIDLVTKEVLKCTALGLKYSKVVKWIIEIAALTDSEIKELSTLIKNVVVDNFGEEKGAEVFVKSSTGFYKTEKGKPNGATFEAIKIMVENSRPLKVKAAGGVKSKEDALKMITLGVDRIGTSSAKQIVDGGSIKTTY
jgi:deoxyribose-phosphate aldolase